nr:MAG TPA: Cytochrome C' [Caudoviricetes sp.]
MSAGADVTPPDACAACHRRLRVRGVALSIGRWCRGASRACGLLGRPAGGACRR